jgi:hypothetical protein
MIARKQRRNSTSKKNMKSITINIQRSANPKE